MSVVDAAVSFAGRLADSSTLAAFRAKLPGTPRHEAGVVIHHTTPAIHGTPQAFVSYDVTLDAASSAVDRHFDQNGIEFRLPQETSGPGTPRH